MKTILYILIFCFGVGSFAQDARIFNTTWYLENVIINGQDNFPPSNSEVPYVGLSIDDSNMLLETGVCNMGSGTIDFSNFNPSFFFSDGMSVALSDCNNSQNAVFETIYFDDFFKAGYIDVSDSFFYNITDDGNGNLSLLITNANGNQAIYGNRMLSTPDLINSDFTIHPNPASEQITLSSDYENINFKIEIFDSTGKMLKNEFATSGKNTLDISSFSAGIYFLKIQSENGDVTVKRFVKE